MKCMVKNIVLIFFPLIIPALHGSKKSLLKRDKKDPETLKLTRHLSLTLTSSFVELLVSLWSHF